jgi:hypothetical protein
MMRLNYIGKPNTSDMFDVSQTCLAWAGHTPPGTDKIDDLKLRKFSSEKVESN